MPNGSAQAMSYHSINFKKGSDTVKNTWDTWHLVPSSRPVVAEAPIVEKYVDITGMHGQLDLSDWPAGLQYQDRVGSWDFIVTTKSLGQQYPVTNDWEDLRTELSTYFDGSAMRVWLDDDGGYEFNGRCRLTSWKTEANYSTVTISYHFSPFKIQTSTIGTETVVKSL